MGQRVIELDFMSDPRLVFSTIGLQLSTFHHSFKRLTPDVLEADLDPGRANARTKLLSNLCEEPTESPLLWL